MKTKILLLLLFCSPLYFWSCLDDLNVEPLDPQSQTPDEVYSDEANYIKGLMKIYSILAMSGQDGSGSSDIEGVDAGNAQLYRAWWNVQQVPTDEAIVAWPDTWVPEMNEMKWTTTKNEALEGVYHRCMYIVSIANEYLLQTTDEMMASRGISSEFMTTVHGYRNEARFMRALAYYMLMDSYGRPPFITEENYSKEPSQLSRAQLFDWIEGELNDLKTVLPIARSIYGRADQGVVNALLSRMYLNAQIYTGTDRYTDCITASKDVIDGGYRLAGSYANLFKADNNQTGALEIIFPIVYDGISTQTYGGTRFLISSSRGVSDIKLSTDGVIDGWGGNRARSTLVKKFEFSNPNYDEDHDTESILDKRGIFYAENRSLEIDRWLKTFDTEGWAVYKYSNVKSNGDLGSHSEWPDTDIPFIRLAEVYLNYAEAVKRGGTGGSETTALRYINDLRERGYGNITGNYESFDDISLDDILDERSRELYWEALRRTDLVRYGYFTTSAYLWPFKGGVKNGSAVETYRNLYPIPASDMSVNSNLEQNEGYK
ncbi:MAG: RagB/SusD family nutrient uptake outer membrane protein [Prevotella sp.]|jgi:hypothetical protein|nr:RagB/SusD family nutrient uptake outer membrane protein [Prevotella sp.]